MRASSCRTCRVSLCRVATAIGDGRRRHRGGWVDRVVGLEGVRAEIAMVETPDGHGRPRTDEVFTPRRAGAAIGTRRRTPRASAMSHSQSTTSTPSSRACEPAARSSLARWSATKTALGSATSAARRGSSSSWRSRSASSGDLFLATCGDFLMATDNLLSPRILDTDSRLMATLAPGVRNRPFADTSAGIGSPNSNVHILGVTCALRDQPPRYRG